MKKIILFLLGGLFWGIQLFCLASTQNNVIRLAIFDNPKIDPNSIAVSDELQESYLQGVNTAIVVAHAQNIDIKRRAFFYGNSLLNIIQQVPNVKAWNPDVIIGLHSSNESLMSRTFFNDTLVLSISASDAQLSESGPTFHSLGTPDPAAINAIIKFINRHYPNANLFLAVGADSKESVDAANLLTSLYKTQHPQQVVTQSKFLSTDTNNLSIPSFMTGYKKGDVIILFSIPGTYDVQVDLMNKIVNYLSPERPIFISTVDSWGRSNSPGNVQDTYDFFRLDSLFIDENTQEYQVFAKNFKRIYHTAPVNVISFLTYQAVMSFVTALKQYPPPKNLSNRDAILWSYQQALKHNPSWFRPTPYAFYKLEPNQETLFETFN